MRRPGPCLLPLHPGAVLPFDLGEFIYFFGVCFFGVNSNHVWHRTRRVEGRRCSELPTSSGNIHSGAMSLCDLSMSFNSDLRMSEKFRALKARESKGDPLSERLPKENSVFMKEFHLTILKKKRVD